MVSIQFQKDGIYHLATDTGGRKEVKIPAGTVQRDLTDAQAERWVRRGVAIRIPDDLTPAVPPAPPPPASEPQPAFAALRERFAAPPPPPPLPTPDGEGNGST